MPISSQPIPTQHSSPDPPRDFAHGDERYELAMESIDYGVYDWDVDGARVYVTPTLALMLGLSTENLIPPARWEMFVHPDDLPVYRRTMIAYLRGESARLECDYRYRAADGS